MQKKAGWIHIHPASKKIVKGLFKEMFCQSKIKI